MRRRSQTRLSVLGALATEPATGYGVRSAIIETLGHFWHESFGQIYPTLTALEAEGLVKRDKEGRFAITSRGRAELSAMLAEEPEPQLPRNGLLLRLFFAAHLPKGRALALVDAAAASARRKLAELEAVERVIVAEGRAESALWRATVRYGVLHAKATIAWADETRQLFTQRSSPSRG
jgi:DNA-binding PadR family transcriptional regulator